MPTVYEVITDRILKQLEAGTVPWHRPWKSPGRGGIPRNLITGREYRGVNTWMLMSSGYASPYFLTYRQALELGGHVRKGESGIPVVFWKIGTRELQDGDLAVNRKSVLCRYYTVFSVAQCEDLRVAPAPDTEVEPIVSPIESCEAVITEWLDKPDIIYGGDRASYSKAADCIRMPQRSAFDSPEEHYSTVFHELTHSTGHPERLNRSSLTEFEHFGDDNYSREELVAEMGAAYLCGYCGIENRTITNSTSYLANWLQVLKSDARTLLIAAGQAQKAVDLILCRNTD